MLQNAYLLAKIGADTAENERNFAENLPNFATTLRVHYPTGRGAASRAPCAVEGAAVAEDLSRRRRRVRRVTKSLQDHVGESLVCNGVFG